MNLEAAPSVWSAQNSGPTPEIGGVLSTGPFLLKDSRMAQGPQTGACEHSWQSHHGNKGLHLKPDVRQQATGPLRQLCITSN